MNHLKLISIRDVGLKTEIPKRGMMRCPIPKILLDDDQLRRLVNMHNGPKCIYFLNPKDPTKSVRVTRENYTKTLSEIFPDKEEVAEAPAVEEATTEATEAETTTTVAEEPAVEEIEETMTVEDVKDPEVAEEVPAITSGYVAFEGDAPAEVVEAETITNVAEDAEPIVIEPAVEEATAEVAEAESVITVAKEPAQMSYSYNSNKKNGSKQYNYHKNH